MCRSSTDKDSVDSSKHPSTDGATGDFQGSRKTLSGCHGGDVAAATFLDIAVLRCLFIKHWQEEGVYWALHYMYNRSVKGIYIPQSNLHLHIFRLRDISEETAGQQQPRRRSNSLPIPKIEVSLFQGNNGKKQDNKDFIEIPEVKDSPLAGKALYIRTITTYE